MIYLNCVEILGLVLLVVVARLHDAHLGPTAQEHSDGDEPGGEDTHYDDHLARPNRQRTGELHV